MISKRSESKINSTFDSKLGATLKSLTLLGIFLSIFAYFVAAGIADELNYDFGSLITTPLDWFVFEVLGFISIVNNLNISQFDFLALTIKSSWPLAICLVAFFYSMLFMDHSEKAVKERRLRIQSKFERFKKYTKSRFIPKILISLILAFLTMPLISILIEATFLAFLSILFSIMITGLSSGKAYVQKNVISADKCLPLSKEQQVKNAKYASCVRISWLTNSGRVSESGRVVVTTPNYVLLYSPNTKQTKRVGINGITILENISEIDTPILKPRK